MTLQHPAGGRCAMIPLFLSDANPSALITTLDCFVPLLLRAAAAAAAALRDHSHSYCTVVQLQLLLLLQLQLLLLYCCSYSTVTYSTCTV